MVYNYIQRSVIIFIDTIHSIKSTCYFPSLHSVFFCIHDLWVHVSWAPKVKSFFMCKMGKERGHHHLDSTNRLHCSSVNHLETGQYVIAIFITKSHHQSWVLLSHGFFWIRRCCCSGGQRLSERDSCVAAPYILTELPYTVTHDWWVTSMITH